jgi:hypothetical protein
MAYNSYGYVGGICAFEWPDFLRQIITAWCNFHDICYANQMVSKARKAYDI